MTNTTSGLKSEGRSFNYIPHSAVERIKTWRKEAERLTTNYQYRNEDFFEVIGRISVSFATLDFFTSELIRRLLPIDKKSQIPFTNRTTLGKKFNILEKMTDEKVIDSDVLADVHKVITEAQEVSLERNRYIHDQWVFNPKKISQGKIVRLKMDVSTNYNEETELTLRELYDFLNRIGELQKQFAGFLKRLPPYM